MDVFHRNCDSKRAWLNVFEQDVLDRRTKFHVQVGYSALPDLNRLVQALGGDACCSKKDASAQLFDKLKVAHPT